MKLPDFNEFLFSMDMEEIAEQIDALNLTEALAVPGCPEAQPALQTAVTSAVQIATLYLRAYHEWLQGQLGREA